MGAKQTHQSKSAPLLLIAGLVALSISAFLATQPTTYAITPASARNVAPDLTATQTCTPSAWITATSNNVGVYNNYLHGVASASANDIWAVGNSCIAANCNDGSLTLIQHWDGMNWNTALSPNGSAERNSLFGVAVASAGDVWAVGSYYSATSSVDQTLIIRWNGSSWSQVASPNIGSGHNYLISVSVISANDVWAVGKYCLSSCQSNNQRTLIMHWNGMAWSVVASPNQGTGDNVLNSVDAHSANDVWTVGTYTNNSNIVQTLIEHWNGSAWSVVTSPNVGSSHNYLQGVAAVSATDAWAVGYFSSSSRQTLIEHWNGSTWSVVSSPNVGTYLNMLNGVTAVSANDLWAVGYYCNANCGSSTSPYQTLTLHWNCDVWSVVPSNNVGSDYTRLLGVAAVSASEAWAVGHSSNSSDVDETLVEHHTGAPCPCSAATPTLTPTPPGPIPTVDPFLTPCPMTFSDVQPEDYFYTSVRYLYCRSVISGYADGLFRPSNNTTRGQLSKIIVLAKNWPLRCPTQATFSDVAIDSVYFCFVETAYARNLVSGYNDGTFGVNNDVTRAQLSKIIVQAQRWPITTVGGPHFNDVPQTDPFYGFIETAYAHGIISGYEGGIFNPANSATRGQICKIVHLAITLR